MQQTNLLTARFRAFRFVASHLFANEEHPQVLRLPFAFHPSEQRPLAGDPGALRVAQDDRARELVQLQAVRGLVRIISGQQ
jgi:hypothetical protein